MRSAARGDPQSLEIVPIHLPVLQAPHIQQGVHGSREPHQGPEESTIVLID